MKHRTKIIQTSQTGPTLFLWKCTCFPKGRMLDAPRPTRPEAVAAAREHRFADGSNK